ncbi:hypothetical protein [Rubrobacter aplysinae]|uniref:hypothetical protein n=1 Tax=Rubrobacter aplysinae TaxID=909625 RepID=UPI00064C0E76|nr:hypothetical protein [Rubrobacter aplysinae]
MPRIAPGSATRRYRAGEAVNYAGLFEPGGTPVEIGEPKALSHARSVAELRPEVDGEEVSSAYPTSYATSHHQSRAERFEDVVTEDPRFGAARSPLAGRGRAEVAGGRVDREEPVHRLMS